MNFSSFKDLTRFEQTLFGLPFVLSGVLLALPHHPFNLIVLFWVLAAFLMARISGMTFNQLIDRHIDAENPRTKNRSIPSGRVSVKQARIIAVSSLFLFLLICWQINAFCFLLAPFAAFMLFIYSYMKRIHASCHFVLGVIHLLGPFMAYTAFSGTFSLAPFFLGLAACFSIIGNDIAYAIQDHEFDLKKRLHSLPVALGVPGSLKLFAWMHFFSLTALICVGVVAKLTFPFYGAALFAAIIFFLFHKKITRQYRKTQSLAGVEPLFFLSTVLVSFSVFFFTLVSTLWDVLF